MRIIAGIYAGRKLATPSGKDAVRPTSGRTKEAIFNILSHGAFAQEGGNALRGARVADLCCGFGALGLEALSRGASFASFVDSDPAGLRIVQRNAAALEIPAKTAEFLCCDCRFLPKAREPFGLVFLDPPYRLGVAAEAVPGLAKSGWAKEGTVLVMECDKRDRWDAEQDGWDVYTERAYGKTKVYVATYRGAARG
jgi:16S rRNA (guanine966-N2)-methyltransferase